MKKLVIKGHSTRGKEVIYLLETLGALRLGYNDTFAGYYYYIECEAICSSDECPIYSTVFTLEEFLDKYPYKVGDKVIYDNSVHEIIDMKWDDNINTISYGVSNGKIKNLAIVEELQPYKEETMEEPEELIVGFTKDNDGSWVLNTHKDYEIKEIDGKFKVIKKQPKYPTTYEECCVYLGLQHYGLTIDLPFNYSPLFISLAQLYICRNAYWKIAGEQMGLGKPWEPDWSDDEWIDMYYISFDGKHLEKEKGYPCCNMILIFPTAEMRDAFYENFKDLIEQCKELL